MNRSELKNLTRRLRELPPAPIPPGLEDRLLADVPRRTRGLMRKRTLVFAVTGAVAAAAALVISLIIPRDSSIARKQFPPVDSTIDEARAEIRDIQAEMQRTLALANRIETRERKAKAEFAIHRSQSAIALERELAATILVMQGDWQRTRGQSGVAEYRRAIELFADTSAAAKAKARLNET